MSLKSKNTTNIKLASQTGPKSRGAGLGGQKRLKIDKKIDRLRLTTTLFITHYFPLAQTDETSPR